MFKFLFLKLFIEGYDSNFLFSMEVSRKKMPLSFLKQLKLGQLCKRLPNSTMLLYSAWNY